MRARYLPLCTAAADPPKSAKTIIDLQLFRKTVSVSFKGEGGKEGLATLINLNPAVNSWYLLRINRGDGSPEETYHLQNARPRVQTLLLEENHSNGLTIVRGKEKSLCDLWGGEKGERLKDARKSATPYAPLCGGEVYLRNPTKGHQSPVEAVTDFCERRSPEGKKSFPLCAIRSTPIFTGRRPNRSWIRYPWKERRT